MDTSTLSATNDVLIDDLLATAARLHRAAHGVLDWESSDHPFIVRAESALARVYRETP